MCIRDSCNATHIGQCRADEIDVVVFHQAIEIPAISPFLASSQRNVHFAAQDGKILLKRLGADGVFDEERSKFLDLVAAANGVHEVEALMKIDYPIGVLANTFPHLGAFFAKMGNALSGVVDAICGSLRGAESEGAIAGVYREPGAILEACLLYTSRCV